MILHHQIDERKVGGIPGGTADDSRDTFLDLCLLLAREKWFIVKVTLAAAVVAAILTLLTPNWYTGTTVILPPQQAQSSAGMMLGGQLGALAGIAGGSSLASSLGLKNPADLYVGVLQSRSIADVLIARFDLQTLYQKSTQKDTRRRLAQETVIKAGKDGMISISVDDRNPKRAADLANAYVEELFRINRRLAFTDAQQRLTIFEQQLEQEKNALADAEVELKKTQERTGVIELSSQASAMIRSVANLQAQIAATEVKLRSVRAFATDQNPEVIELEQELAGLKAELDKAERNEVPGKGNVAVPTGKVPELGLEYIRKLREVRYHEALFEILAKQYEAARIDEAKQAPVIQVVDPAVIPDKKSGPLRTITVIIASFFGAILACVFVKIRHSLRMRAQSDPSYVAKVQELKERLIPRIRPGGLQS